MTQQEGIQPICPVTLVTLAETLSQLHDPAAAAVSQGDGHTLHGVESQAAANPSQLLQQQSSPKAAVPETLAANLPTLQMLMWVHSAAAQEAWQTLQESASKLDVTCVSR